MSEEVIPIRDVLGRGHQAEVLHDQFTDAEAIDGLKLTIDFIPIDYFRIDRLVLLNDGAIGQ